MSGRTGSGGTSYPFPLPPRWRTVGPRLPLDKRRGPRRRKLSPPWNVFSRHEIQSMSPFRLLHTCPLASVSGPFICGEEFDNLRHGLRLQPLMAGPSWQNTCRASLGRPTVRSSGSCRNASLVGRLGIVFLTVIGGPRPDRLVIQLGHVDKPQTGSAVDQRDGHQIRVGIEKARRREPAGVKTHQS